MPDASNANIFTAQFDYDDADPAGYRAGVYNLNDATGRRDLAVKLYEIPPGESLCPYHYEYTEEWLIVLAGTLILRDPNGGRELHTGDVAAFPPGQDGAHKITATHAGPARVLMFSSAAVPAVAVYPDSDKIGVWPDAERDHLMVRRADGSVPYYDGEA